MAPCEQNEGVCECRGTWLISKHWVTIEAEQERRGEKDDDEIVLPYMRD